MYLAVYGHIRDLRKTLNRILGAEDACAVQLRVHTRNRVRLLGISSTYLFEFSEPRFRVSTLTNHSQSAARLRISAHGVKVSKVWYVVRI